MNFEPSEVVEKEEKKERERKNITVLLAKKILYTQS
jgi:hypothetical protein